MAEQTSAPHTDPSSVKVVVTSWAPVSKSQLMMVFSWLMPFIIMATGYGFFPAIRSPITWPWNAPGGIWIGIATQLMMLIVWILYEIWYTTHRNTSVTQLQTDAVGDLVIAVVLAFMLGASITAGTLQWWFIVPLIGAGIDVVQSSFLAINNAAEKPYSPPMGQS